MAFDDGFVINGGDKPADDGVKAKFYVDAVLDGPATQEAKRPVYKDAEFVRISVVGDKTSDIRHRVTNEHRQRFPREYAQFQSHRAEEAINGTPLKLWPPLSISKVREFTEAGIRSVEQLSQANAEKLGGDSADWIALARKWLNDLNDLREENARLRAEVASLKGSTRRRAA